MKKVDYIAKTDQQTLINTTSGQRSIPNEWVLTAVKDANERIKQIGELAPEVITVLGMRNLSAFMGELFVRSLEKVSQGLLIKNPHQDGYPDLLLMTDEAKLLMAELKDHLREKSPFSGFKTGGVEVKATCGSIPTPAVFFKKGFSKPDIGDQRVDFLIGYDWKAHHRSTNNLFGIFWDFIEGIPMICAVFYSGKLTTESWGTIIQPREGGGRTTSVSIMTRSGVFEMYQGWIVVINDARYINFFNRFNKADLIAVQ